MVRRFILNYLSEGAVIWSALAFYRFNPYHNEYFGDYTHSVLLWLAVGYSLFAIPVMWKKAAVNQPSKGLIFLRVLYGLLAFSLRRILRRSEPKTFIPTKDEVNVMLFWLIRLFFIPLMVEGASWHFINVWKTIAILPGVAGISPAAWFNTWIYPLAYSLFFFFSTAIYGIGYMVESPALGNQVRSVDRTLMGWGFALICYPPFLGIASIAIPFLTPSTAFFLNEEVTMAVRLFILFTLSIMLHTDFFLGLRCCNLTHRGIVTGGPYRFVRHPHYATKLAVWWIAVLPEAKENLLAMVYLAIWTWIYYRRAVTEERHLLQDAEYRKYFCRVRYRFVPGVT